MGADNHVTTVPTNAENSEAHPNADIRGTRENALVTAERKDDGDLVEVRENDEFVGYVFMHEIADIARE